MAGGSEKIGGKGRVGAYDSKEGAKRSKRKQEGIGSCLRDCLYLACVPSSTII